MVPTERFARRRKDEESHVFKLSYYFLYLNDVELLPMNSYSQRVGNGF